MRSKARCDKSDRISTAVRTASPALAEKNEPRQDHCSLYRQQTDRFKESQPSRVPRVAPAIMVPARPTIETAEETSERSRGVDVIWLEQVALEKEKILEKVKARQAPSPT